MSGLRYNNVNLYVMEIIKMEQIIYECQVDMEWHVK